MRSAAAVVAALLLLAGCSAEPGHFVPEMTEQPPPYETPLP
jgi:hypothetical protein